MTTTRALVLAGGGLAGIAWELGVLRGVADVDPELAARLAAADVLVGTSAGSSVAAQISGGASLDELYAAQLAEVAGEIEVDVDLAALFERFTAVSEGVTSTSEVRRRIAALALEVETVDESVRLEAIRRRIRAADWPDRDVRVTAVDASTGERVVFDRSSRVPFVDAVAASCAVPGVWPPVTIGDTRYVDGGVHSGSNADVAAGAAIVVILTPTVANAPAMRGRSLDDEIVDLGAAAIYVVHADEASVAAFGANPLSPTTRKPSALAGREIGRQMAPQVATVWG
ncbi:MAG: patatin-like phospholipase family protein [Lapillicoccus sp.]